MAGTNVSQVYISVIEDVVANVREDFITYGVGDAVLNELQAVSFFFRFLDPPVPPISRISG
jgi:hypothetical protein